MRYGKTFHKKLKNEWRRKRVKIRQVTAACRIQPGSAWFSLIGMDELHREDYNTEVRDVTGSVD